MKQDKFDTKNDGLYRLLDECVDRYGTQKTDHFLKVILESG